jgi:prepilin-type processing-associated H-X9-DG protein
MDMIYPYVKSVQVFQCPSFNTSATSSDVREGLQYQMNGAYSNATLSTYATSNEVNYATYQYGKTILHTGTPVSAVLRPAEAIMIFEARGLYCAYGLLGVASLVPANGQKALEPHLGGMNLAFGDGHVKWMSSSQIFAQTGNGSTGACVLEYAANSLYNYQRRPLCSKLWNPFLP